MRVIKIICTCHRRSYSICCGSILLSPSRSEGRSSSIVSSLCDGVSRVLRGNYTRITCRKRVSTPRSKCVLRLRQLAHSYLRDDINYPVFFDEPVILAVDRNSRRRDTRHYKNTRVQRVLGGIAGSHYFSPVTPDYRSSRYVLDDKCSRHSLSRGYMCSTRYIRAHAKRHYNAPGSSLFRIAYTLDTFSPLLPFPFFFASISP